MQPERVGIFGTGVMAYGLARLCLSAGSMLVVASGSPGRADDLRAKLLEDHPEGHVSTERGDLNGCLFLLEATVEDLDAKRAALAGVEALVPADAILATTTSSLSITELAAPLRRPERFLGLHFFNPVHRMPLIEVVRGLRTEERSLRRGEELAAALGKVSLRVPDRAGFLVNRLLIPYLNQAARLVETGYASLEEVDLAMTLGAGHPMGPFALMDLIGLDVCLAIGRSLEEEFHRTCDSPPPELRRRVSLGLLGRKSGRGYHRYDEG